MVSTSTLVSVCMPHFNDVPALCNTLRSWALVARRIYREYQSRVEVIVVDNNSEMERAKDLVAQVRAVQEEDNEDGAVCVTLVHQPRLPHPFALCRARNLASRLAKGRFLFFTDSDCMVNPASMVPWMAGWLEAESGESGETGIWTGERIFAHVPGPVLAEQFSQDEYFAELAACPVASASNYYLTKDRRLPWLIQLPDAEQPWSFGHGCFLFMEKALYDRVGGSNEDMDFMWGYEDVELLYRAHRDAGAKLYYAPSVKVYHQDADPHPERNPSANYRPKRSENRNYQLVCEMIEGFAEFKSRQFDMLSV